MAQSTAVRYYSRSGHTKRIAEVIAGVVSCKAEPITVPLDKHVDLLFLGASVYWGGISSEVKDYIQQLDKEKIGRVVVFSTSALTERAFPQIRDLLQKKGIPVASENFYCRGEFTALHRGHPNKADLNQAVHFARKMMGGS